MKKLIFLFLIFLFVLTGTMSFGKVAYARSTHYARVAKNNVGFYSSPITSDDYLLFYLEQTYFVKVYEEDIQGFYHVEYIDIDGYVKKEDVVFINGQPNTPYPIGFNVRVYVPGGLNLRTSPETTGPFNILCNVPFYESNLVYYGYRIGEQAITLRTDIWYYCKYLTQEAEYEGFLYSEFCDSLDDIPINTEQFEIIEPPVFKKEVVETSAEVDAISSLSKPVQIVVIILVCIPCILIVYLLFKPTKITVEESRTKKKKVKKLRKSDYYEFDDYN